MLFPALLILFLVVQPAAAARQRILAFTHVTVIDATGAPAQADVTVVIMGERITTLGRSVDVQPPDNAEIVDATGKFLIPGLWDMHVHWEEKDYMPLFIANGVTGIRIMWGMPLHHAWRKEREQGLLLSPRMLIASAIVDGPKPIWPRSTAVSNEAEAREAVRQAHKDGADFIKVYSLLPRDAYFAIADEAKKEGIPFEGHVPVSVSVEEASAAGQRTIEHLTGVLPACSDREAELLKSAQEALAGILATNPPRSMVAQMRRESELAMDAYSPVKAEAVFAEFKKNQTWQCPTLTVLRLVTFFGDASVTNDIRLKYMPPGVKADWYSPNDNGPTNRALEKAAFGEKYFQKHLEIVGAMQRAGVDILAGTDTGNPYCFPGFSLHDELGLLVRAGLTPMEALQAATRNPARFMGRENELGTIEKGKLADLVLLDANPLDDIANTRKIAAVVLGGRLFPKASLDGMLTKIEALASKGRISVADVLAKTIEDQGGDAAVTQYRELKSTQPGAYNFNEAQLNELGNQLLSRKRVKDAIKILQLNVEAYPKSSNVYDSLGKAYSDNGDAQQALENYEKSIQLGSRNSGAIEKIRQLKGS
jgi:imidazolonepropionase-like amidohydrolase